MIIPNQRVFCRSSRSDYIILTSSQLTRFQLGRVGNIGATNGWRSPIHLRLERQIRLNFCTLSSHPENAEMIQLPVIEKSIPRTFYVGMEVVVLLGMSALVDAAYSGDWSRIGVISKEVELILQKVCLISLIGHSITSLFAMKHAQAVNGHIVTAGLKGFFFGALGLNEVLQSRGAEKSQEGQES